jgi:hypothetical protein
VWALTVNCRCSVCYFRRCKCRVRRKVWTLTVIVWFLYPQKPGCIGKCGGRWFWLVRCVPGLWWAGGPNERKVWLGKCGCRDVRATVGMDATTNHWGGGGRPIVLVDCLDLVYWMCEYMVGPNGAAMLPVRRGVCCWWRRGYAAGKTRLCSR